MELDANSLSAIAFVTAEVDQVHAFCDRALVPRWINGVVLSMAQRVGVLEGCYVGLAGRLGMNPPSTLH